MAQPNGAGDRTPASRRAVTGIGLVLALLAAPTAGCAGRRARDPERVAATAPPGDGAEVSIRASATELVLEDVDGRRLLEAKHDRVEGGARPGGEYLPVRMKNVRARLYKQGRPQMVVTAPEAVWANGQLLAEKNVHVESIDGKTRLDGQRAVWTSKTGQVAMDQARCQTLSGGREDVNAEGARLEFVDGVATLPSGVRAFRPGDGSEARARRVTWNTRTGELNASGEVVFTNREGRVVRADTVRWQTRVGRITAERSVRLESPEATATAGRLEANTALKVLRLSGRAHMWVKRLPRRPAATGGGRPRRGLR